MYNILQGAVRGLADCGSNPCLFDAKARSKPEVQPAIALQQSLARLSVLEGCRVGSERGNECIGGEVPDTATKLQIQARQTLASWFQTNHLFLAVCKGRAEGRIGRIASGRDGMLGQMNRGKA